MRTEDTAVTARPPRLFLRRFAALIIDSLAYIILFTFLMAVLAMAVPSLKAVLPSPLLYSRVCSSETADLPAFAEIQAAWQTDNPRTSQLCTVESFYLPAKQFAVVTESREDSGGSTYTRSLTVALDADGNAIFPNPVIAKVISTLRILLFPLVLALAMIGFGQTPGKRLMSLVVTKAPLAKEPVPLSPAGSVIREYAKFWPVCANALIQLAIAVGAPRITDVAGAVSALEAFGGVGDRTLVDALVLNAATFFVLFVWWVWPLALWRGRMLYDGFIRCYVVLRD
ncbi:RDD family protein [Martelella endophytica]|uniref:Uncharacterized protein n=1 Tax=Martelella endophytica TaxID=1486262 RepID=A0A0D5LSA8_MAREN|nr:RDD family protein [Martelella endophytica]AJY46956.1 hypothetical protein TM49_16725 [Martelella endophytica]